MTSLRWRVRDELPGLLVVAVVAVVYLALVPQSVVGGDNGEFALLAHAQGIAHPPGYPLYVGLLRLLRWLPAGSPVQAAGYATALMAGVQMLCSYFACRCWRVPAWAAAIAVAFYAGSPLALLHLTHAEVFALNGVIVAVILAVCSPFPWLSGERQLAALGLLCGLGFAHHHSFVLLAPCMAFGAFSAWKRLRHGRRSISIGLAVVAFLIGFAPNLLLFSWSQPDGVYLQSWGVIRAWPDFWHHFLRSDYGTLSLAASQSRGSVLGEHMLNLLSQLHACWKFLLPLSLCAFAVHLRWSGFQTRGFWAWLALLLSCLAAGPLFFSRANIDTVVGAPSMEVVQRFFLLPTQLLLLPVAEGLRLFVQVLQRLCRPVVSNRGALGGAAKTLLLSAFALYALGFNLVISARQTRISRGSHTQDLVRNSLASMPRGAVLVLRADDELFAGSYLQEVEKLRPDLLLVNTIFLLRPWYIPRLARRLPDCPWPKTTLGGFFEHVIERCQRDVLINLADDRSEFAKSLYRRFPNYQYGPFRRVLPRGQRVPTPEAVFHLNQRLFASFVMPQRKVSLAHGWASRPGYVYAETWKSIARDMLAASRPDLAEEAMRLSVRYGYCREGDCLTD